MDPGPLDPRMQDNDKIEDSVSASLSVQAGQPQLRAAGRAATQSPSDNRLHAHPIQKGPPPQPEQQDAHFAATPGASSGATALLAPTAMANGHDLGQQHQAALALANSYHHRGATVSVMSTPDGPSLSDMSASGFGSPEDHNSDALAHCGGDGGGIGIHDPKKPRACEACRGLKVRCDPDPDNAAAPCRRCAKAGRSCLVTQPSRKRQKKTDTRVAELEKKIDALTQSLQAKGAGGGGSDASGVLGPSQLARDWTAAAASSPPSQGRDSAGSATAASAAASNGRQLTGGRDCADLAESGKYACSAAASTISMTGLKRRFASRSDGGGDDAHDMLLGAAAAPPDSAPEADIVDQGLLSSDLAADLFLRFTEMMVPHIPAVVFPPGTTAAELRKSRPVLFLAVMAAASSELPALQKQLTKELMQVLAEKVLVVGEKSIELVQAMHVSVIWYCPPEHFEEVKFYQLVHIAAVMSLEIGLGRKRQARSGMRKNIAYSWRDHPWRRTLPPDPTTIEARRTWLVCYFMTTNTAMTLHRPNLVHWSPFMAECMDVLETSPDAAPTDRYLCHLVYTHKLAEEIGAQLCMDDPSAVVSVADSRAQHALKGFERELEKYQAAIAPEMMQPSLKLSLHAISLYMHEIATQSNADEFEHFPLENVRDSGLPGSDNSQPLTQAHIHSLSACLTAIDGIFDTFLFMDVHSIRCLPVFNFVRIAYAVVVLIKMYFAASSPKAELGKVINKDEMRVEQHIENLLDKFRQTAADDKSRPAAKFLVVLVMLRSWFQKQKDSSKDTDEAIYPWGGNPLGRPGSAATSAPDKEGAVFSAMANTPLQLLSEIATNKARPGTADTANVHDLAAASNGQEPASSTTMPSPGASNWFRCAQPSQQQQFVFDSGGGEASAAAVAAAAASIPATPVANLANQLGSSFPPWLNNAVAAAAGPGLGSGDLDYANYGDAGFMQAMDLTLTGVSNGGFGFDIMAGMGMGSLEGMFPMFTFPGFDASIGAVGGAASGAGCAVAVDGRGNHNHTSSRDTRGGGGIRNGSATHCAESSSVSMQGGGPGMGNGVFGAYSMEDK